MQKRKYHKQLALRLFTTCCLTILLVIGINTYIISRYHELKKSTPTKNALLKLKKQISFQTEQLNQIAKANKNTLLHQDRQQKLNWLVNLLTMVANTLPTSCLLNEITIQKNKITLSGNTNDIDSIHHYLQSLQQTRITHAIKLMNISKYGNQNTDTQAFKILMVNGNPK